MSAAGFTNLNTSVSHSQNSAPAGGAAPPYQNGKTGHDTISLLTPKQVSMFS